MRRASCVAVWTIPLAGLLGGGSPALAGDGVVEINQACAMTGCFPGDVAGFPVTISQPGSYRLTSNLGGFVSVPLISIQSERVTLDLGGFAAEGGGGTGVATIQGGHRVAVRNGYVRASSADGVQLGGSSRVEDLHVHHNTLAGVRIAGEGIVRNVVATSNQGEGIAAGDASVIEGCTATANGSHGIRLTSGVVRGSTATQNAGRGGEFGSDVSFEANLFRGNAGDVAGGHPSGGNVCGDASCTTDGRRRYYLTTTPVDGAHVHGSCAPGFHVASLFELTEPGTLHYDRTRGIVDGAGGPPSGFPRRGWVESGTVDYATAIPGGGNCYGYTSVQGFHQGSALAAPLDWSTAGPLKWVPHAPNCSESHRVWCVED